MSITTPKAHYAYRNMALTINNIGCRNRHKMTQLENFQSSDSLIWVLQPQITGWQLWWVIQWSIYSGSTRPYGYTEKLTSLQVHWNYCAHDRVQAPLKKLGVLQIQIPTIDNKKQQSQWSHISKTLTGVHFNGKKN